VVWCPGTLRLERQIKARGPVNYCPLCRGARVLLIEPVLLLSPGRRRILSRPDSVKGCPKGRR
jgi:hypothetical protein